MFSLPSFHQNGMKWPLQQQRQQQHTADKQTESLFGQTEYYIILYIILYHISYIISYYIILYHIISYIISYHIISYYISSLYIIYILYHIILNHILSYHIISYHIWFATAMVAHVLAGRLGRVSGQNSKKLFYKTYWLASCSTLGLALLFAEVLV